MNQLVNIHILRRLSSSVAALILAATCLGMDCQTDPLMQMDDSTVSFSREIQPIFDTHCIRCHVTGGFANNSGIPLRLIEGVSHGLLVNKSSVQNPDWLLVKPRDPDNSLLYQKISQASPPVGRQMPWDAGTVVSPDEIELIRRWIEEGARNN